MEGIAKAEIGTRRPFTQYFQEEKWRIDSYPEIINKISTESKTFAVSSKQIIQHVIAEQFSDIATDIHYLPRPLLKTTRSLILPLNSPMTKVLSRGRILLTAAALLSSLFIINTLLFTGILRLRQNGQIDFLIRKYFAVRKKAVSQPSSLELQIGQTFLAFASYGSCLLLAIILFCFEKLMAKKKIA